jgi:rhodanese-related sulfurtransferase
VYWGPEPERFAPGPAHFEQDSWGQTVSSTNSELRITPENGHAMVQAGQAIVLDVISSSVYPLMHEAIAGAIRIPPEELFDRLDELPKSVTIITYCT